MSWSTSSSLGYSTGGSGLQSMAARQKPVAYPKTDLLSRSSFGSTQQAPGVSPMSIFPRAFQEGSSVGPTPGTQQTASSLSAAGFLRSSSPIKMSSPQMWSTDIGTRDNSPKRAPPQSALPALLRSASPYRGLGGGHDDMAGGGYRPPATSALLRAPSQGADSAFGISSQLSGASHRAASQGIPSGASARTPSMGQRVLASGSPSSSMWSYPGPRAAPCATVVPSANLMAFAASPRREVPAPVRDSPKNQNGEDCSMSTSCPIRSPPPFYWVPTVDTITEFEVSGAFGEVVSKTSDFEDSSSALPIAGTLRMTKGGLYLWTLQIVRQCAHRPQLQFGIHGANHARPWRLVSTGRCSRSRDDGPWLARPGGDMAIGEGDYVHCEADLRGLDSPLGSFAFAVNDGAFETVFEDIPLSEGALQPVVAMGGGGTTCRLCAF